VGKFRWGRACRFVAAGWEQFLVGRYRLDTVFLTDKVVPGSGWLGWVVVWCTQIHL
jgi:hypothetical protein